jgi:3-carboxy-cis,cis-muconate cycloisomerase
MARNLAASRGYVASERVLAALAPELGKHSAQALLQEALRAGAARGRTLEDTLRASPDLWAHLDAGAMRSLLAGPGTGSAGAMVDEVVGRLRAAAGREEGPWP